MSMPWLSLFPMLLMLAFGGYAIYRWVTATKGMVPAMRTFLEQTGYRLPNAGAPDVETSVQRWQAEWNAQKAHSRYDVTLARTVQGVPIVHRNFMGPSATERNTYMMSAWWRAEVPGRVGFHIADRSIGGLGQRLAGLMTNMNRNFTARYSVPVQTGDPELDRRFQIYGVDAAAVAQALRSPGLKEALLATPEVDLYVGQEGIVFNDPQQKNMRAGMGGTLGAMAIGANMGKMLQISIGVHDKITHLLLLTAQAVR